MSGRDAGTGGAAEHPGDLELVALLGCLVPGADATLLVRALRAELARGTGTAVAPGPRPATDPPAAERELRRLRAQLAVGESARMLLHAINNPLTALLAEAQLLELDLPSEPHRLAASRIVELARRVAAEVKRLDMPSAGAGG